MAPYGATRASARFDLLLRPEPLVETEAARGYSGDRDKNRSGANISLRKNTVQS